MGGGWGREDRKLMNKPITESNSTQCAYASSNKDHYGCANHEGWINKLAWMASAG
jgi:hypothetical protein